MLREAGVFIKKMRSQEEINNELNRESQMKYSCDYAELKPRKKGLILETIYNKQNEN